MDLQTMVDAIAEQERQDTFSQSEQLTLGELTLLLGQVDVGKLVFFDTGDVVPTGLGGWRGSYKELAIRYGDE